MLRLIITFLLVNIYIFSSVNIYAQCPVPGTVTINPSDATCFGDSNGEIEFTFVSGTPPDGATYRVQLYDFIKATFVWDDNNPPFLNEVPAPTFVGNVTTFTGLPAGDYILVLSQAPCPDPADATSIYELGFSGLPWSGIRIGAVNPEPVGTLSSSAATICEAGSIDLTFTATVGTGPYDIIVDGITYNTVASGAVFATLTEGVDFTGTTNFELTSITDLGVIPNCAAVVSDIVGVTVNPLPAGTISNSGPICAGSAVDLTFTATAGTGNYDIIVEGVPYNNVLSGAVFATLTEGVDFTGTTIFELTSITDLGVTPNCVAIVSETTTVTVNPLPAGTISNTGPICAGGTVDLTFTATAGTGNYDIIVEGVPYNNVSSGAVFATLTEGVDFTGTTIFELTSITDLGVTPNCLAIVSETTTVTVNPEPVGTLSSSAATICESGSIDLTFTATVGTGPYDIIVDGITYNTVASGAVFATLTEGVDFTGTTNFELTSITDLGVIPNCAAVVSDIVGVTVNPLPAGTISNSGPICAGSTVDLTFTATAGTGNYDIIVEGVPYNNVLSGAVFATLTEGVDFTGTTIFELTSITDLGVTPNCVAIVSETTTVTVNPLPAGTISNTGPICAGGTVDLTFTATAGTGNYDIIVEGVPYNNVSSGAVFATLTEGVDFTGTTIFELTSITDLGVTPNCAAIVSETTTVTVNPEPVGTLSSSAATICEAGSIDLTFTATVGTGPYDIIVDGITYNTVASGAVFATLTEGVDFTGTTNFELTSITDLGVTPNCAAVVSDIVGVTVNPLPAGTISNSGPICAGSAVDLTFTATAGTGNYDIIVEGVPYNNVLSGAVFATLTEGVDFTGTTIFELTSITDLGVTPNCVAIVSETTTVTVNPLPAGTISNTGPICAGGTVDLTFTATAGTGNYDIIVEGVPYNNVSSGAVFATLTEGVDFTGTTIFELTSITDLGVTPNCAAIVSETTTVTVNPEPVGTLSSSAATICEAGSIDLTFTATVGTGPYDIIVDGITYNTVASGAVFATLAEGVDFTGTTNFELTSITDLGVTPNCAAVVSDIVIVTVNPLPAGTISNSGPICAGSAVDLTFTATAGTGNYDIIVEGVPYNNVLSGAVFATLTEGVDFTGTTIFELTSITDLGVTPNCVAIVSETTTVTVNPLPAGTISNTGPICAGGTVDLTFTATAGTGNYDIIVEGVPYNNVSSGAVFATLTEGVDFTGTTIFELTSITDLGVTPNCAAIVSETTTVTVNPEPVGTLSSSAATICEAGSIDLTFTATVGTGPYDIIVDGITYNTVASGAVFATLTEGVDFTGTTNFELTSITDLGVTPNCAAVVSDIETVMVNPLPAGTISSSLTDICEAGSIDLTFTATVGTGNYDIIVEGVPYNNVSSGAVFVTLTEGVDFTGTTIFELTSITDLGVTPNCAAVVSETATVTVNPTPAGTIASSAATICEAGSIDLTFTATAGTGPFDIIVEGITYNNVASGAVFATLTEGVDFTGTSNFELTSITDVGVTPNCAVVVSDIVIVTVNPLPAGTIASSAATICEAGSIDLTFTATVGTGPYDIIVDGITYNTVASGAVFATLTEGVDFTGTTNFELTSITDLGVTPNCAATVSDIETVMVNPLPAGTISSSLTDICEAGSIDLTFTATVGTGNYDIIVEGVPYNNVSSGAVFATLTEGVDFTGTTIFELTSITDLGVTPNCAAVVSETATVTVNPTPAGTIASSAATICEAGSIDLTFTATAGTGPFDIIVEGITYNNVASGAVFATLTEGVDFTGTSNFELTSITDVGVTPNCAVVVSDIVIVTVNPLPAGTIASSAATICEAGSIDLTFTATVGTGPYDIIVDGITYNTVASGAVFATLTEGVDFTGTTNFELTSITDLGVTPNCAAVVSDIVGVTVNPLPVGTISSSLTDICEAGSIDLTFTATVGTGNYDIIVEGVPYNNVSSGAVFVTLTEGVDFTGTTIFELTSITDLGVTPNCAAVVSETTTVTVNPTPAGTLSSSAATICEAGSIDLTFTATVGTGPFDIIVEGITYNNVASGAVFATLTEGVDFTGTSNFELTSITDVGVTPNCAVVVSDIVIVTVNPLPAGTIASSAATICEAGSIDLTFTATVGTGPYDIIVDGITYNTVASGAVFATLTEGVDFTGTTNFELTSITDLGVIPNCAATVSDIETVTVNPLPAGTISSSLTDICEAGTIDLTFTATVGTGNYDIIVEGVPYNNVSSGAVFATLTEGVDFTGTTIFELTSITDLGVTPNCAAVVSETATVTVNPTPAGTLSSSAATICEAGSIDLTFTATVGTGPFDIIVEGITYNSVSSGAVFATLTEGVDFTGTSNFELTSITDVGVTPNCAVVVSDIVIVTVNPLPAGTIASSAATICEAGSIDLTFTATVGTGPYDIIVEGITYNNIASGAVFATLTEGVDFTGTTNFELTSITDLGVTPNCAASVSDIVSIALFPTTSILFSLENLSDIQGSTILMPVKVQGFTDMVTSQFTVKWDASVIQYNTVSNFATINDLDISTITVVDPSTITFTWSEGTATPQSIANGDTLFIIQFDMGGPECSASTVVFDGSPVAIFGTDLNGCSANISTTNGSASILGTGSSAPPSVAFSDSLNCINDVIPTLMAAGVNIKWYSDAALSDSVGAGNSFTPVLDNTNTLDTTFYATQTIGLCGESLSDSTRIQYISTPGLPVPNQSTYTICVGDPAPTLQATGTGINWYADSLLTSLVGTGNSYIPGPGELDVSVADTTYFYVTQSNQCGDGPYETVAVIVQDASSPPIIVTPVDVCQGTSAPALTATGSNIKWYSDSLLTNQVGIGSSYTPAGSELDMNTVGSTSFYVTQDDGCGESAYADMVVNVITCSVTCSDFVVSTIPDNTTCSDSNDGSILMLIVNPIPGTFQYSLDNGSTYHDFAGPNSTQTPDTLVAGTYEVLVQANGSGCPADTSSVVVGSQVVLLATTDINEPTCGDDNGSVRINVAGGSAPYTIDMVDSDGNSLLPDSVGLYSGLSIGNYFYSVTENSGCSFTPADSVRLVGENDNLTTSVAKKDPSCNASDGQIAISVLGGSGFFTYYLTDSASSVTSNQTGIFIDLFPGNYLYAVDDDSSGCSIPSQSVTLNNEASIIAVADTSSFENALCFNQPTGRAIINVSGGSGSYEYSLDGSNWIPFVSGNYIENLPPNGTFIALVRESAADLCYAQTTLTILNEYPELKYTYTTVDASCANNDGEIEITSVSGGAEPYVISFENGSFDPVDLNNLPIFSSLTGGIKTLILRDNVGCESADTSILVNFPGYVDADIQSTAPTCDGMGKDGTVTILVFENNANPPPYNYGFAANGVPIDEVDLQPILAGNQVVIDTLKNGSYYVLLSAGDGCFSRTDVIVGGGPQEITFDITSVTDPNCKGETGAITIENISGSTSDDFLVELLRLSDLATIYSDLLSNADVTNGITIDSRVTDQIVAGEYQVRISQNQSGCNMITVSETIEIEEPSGLLDFDVIGVTASFPDRATGTVSIQVNPTGGDPYEASIETSLPFFPGQEIFIDWTEVDQDSNNPNIYRLTFEELYSGVYDLYVKDQFGCEVEKEVTVNFDSAIFIPNVFSPNDDNYNDNFYIRNLPPQGTGTRIVISNRWGKVVFESDDYHEDNLWDGGDNSDGVFFYQLSVPDKGDFSGWVEIWRGGSR